MRRVNAIPLVDLTAQYATIKDEIDRAVQEVLGRCNFILGSQVQEFEQSFARFAGVEHAIAVSNGLDALRLSLMAVDVGPGDEVIVPANTYIATALAVSSVGARPVFVDCDASTYNIDVGLIEAAINGHVHAIIPVHLTGQSADMDPMLEIAERHGLYVVEDAAQAHGTLYKGRPCGSMGVMGCFSFYPGKNLGACGDAGMVTTNDSDMAERLRRLRNYGQSFKYEHVGKGLNARMDTLQAAILRTKLRHLKRWNEARAAHAEKYRELLSGVGDVVFQQRAPYSSHIYHLFIIETDQRDALRKYLEMAGIQTGIHYPKPIHLQEAYADTGYRIGDFPCAERLAGRILSLPMFPELSIEQIHYVVDEVRTFFNNAHPHGV
ncbi:MAG: DegT/DnrJ/EryC1/StrS family aminotransferase [Thermoplasmata archaeon]|nr:MAG: DegT/DnrJ/EryC1/StrS family aminotransferase [Thermoplasmata archaeon]